MKRGVEPGDARRRADGLVLIFSREGRHAEVERLARELQMEAPRNRLLVLEEGAAAIRAGRAREAEAALTRGLAVFARDNGRRSRASALCGSTNAASPG